MCFLVHCRRYHVFMFGMFCLQRDNENVLIPSSVARENFRAQQINVIENFAVVFSVPTINFMEKKGSITNIRSLVYE